jgi:hypothetical protein
MQAILVGWPRRLESLRMEVTESLLGCALGGHGAASSARLKIAKALNESSNDRVCNRFDPRKWIVANTDLLGLKT